MKKLVFLFIILLPILSLGQDIKCDQFKNGMFKITDEKLGTCIIERNGDTQIEIGIEAAIKLEFRVVWLNDCTYTLELKKILDNPNNTVLPEDMILIVTIIETKANSYIQKSTSNLSDMEYISEMVKIE